MLPLGSNLLAVTVLVMTALRPLPVCSLPVKSYNFSVACENQLAQLPLVHVMDFPPSAALIHISLTKCREKLPWFVFGRPTALYQTTSITHPVFLTLAWKASHKLVLHTTCVDVAVLPQSCVTSELCYLRAVLPQSCVTSELWYLSRQSLCSSLV